MKQFLILILLCGFATATAAQESETQPAPTDQQSATAIGAESSDDYVDRNCLRQTGSRITATENDRARRAGETPDKCAPAPGRVYTREDIERTGAVDLKQALRTLDPSIR